MLDKLIACYTVGALNEIGNIDSSFLDLRESNMTNSEDPTLRSVKHNEILLQGLIV